MRQLNCFLDYAATHPEATVIFYRSDMIPVIHTNALYLNKPGAKSRAGGYLF